MGTEIPPHRSDRSRTGENTLPRDHTEDALSGETLLRVPHFARSARRSASVFQPGGSSSGDVMTVRATGLFRVYPVYTS